eukprot:15335879-Ditylum_brightwellii.AAC.1
MDVNQDKPGIISWRLWRKAMTLWTDEETICQPLGEWYKSGNDLNWTCPSYYNFTNDCLYNTCTFNNSQHVQWTPTGKTAPVKVKTTDGTLTWQ